MQHYSQNGKCFYPMDPTAHPIHENVPNGTYTVSVTPTGAFYLEAIKPFELAGKLYGNVDTNAKRIINTFLDRPNCTGVLLSGQKGSGKTMLSKRVSQLLGADGIITIVINTPFCGEGFNAFIASITQPALIIFDEFEKTYDRDDQQKLLTIFDGTYPSKKLFVLTTNDKYRIDEYMHNRPGRIYYALDFGGLDATFVREYCEDNLANKALVDNVVSTAAVFSSFSFDMLKALVEEMNRYGETAPEALKILNMKPESDFGNYQLSVVRNGVKLVGNGGDGTEIKSSPLGRNGHLIGLYAFDDEDYERAGKPEGAVREYTRVRLDSARIKRVDPDTGTMIFGTDREDTIIVATRVIPKAGGFDYGLVY